MTLPPELFPNLDDGWRIFCTTGTFLASIMLVSTFKKSRFMWMILGMNLTLVLNWISYLVLGLRILP